MIKGLGEKAGESYKLIKGIAIGIIAFGVVLGIILGNAFPVVTIKYSLLTETHFNLALMLYVIGGSVLLSSLYFILAHIIENQYEIMNRQASIDEKARAILKLTEQKEKKIKNRPVTEGRFRYAIHIDLWYL